MWGNSEFGIQNGLNTGDFSQGFLAFSEKLGILRSKTSLQKNFWRKEYEKS